MTQNTKIVVTYTAWDEVRGERITTRDIGEFLRRTQSRNFPSLPAVLLTAYVHVELRPAS